MINYPGVLEGRGAQVGVGVKDSSKGMVSDIVSLLQ